MTVSDISHEKYTTGLPTLQCLVVQKLDSRKDWEPAIKQDTDFIYRLTATLLCDCMNRVKIHFW